MLLQPPNAKHRMGCINGFNTASGKCCCNENVTSLEEGVVAIVSIPQAVSAVATTHVTVAGTSYVGQGFNTASGKCCCNCQENQNSWTELLSFQYRKR